MGKAHRKNPLPHRPLASTPIQGKKFLTHMQTSYPVTSRVRVCGCTQRRTNHSLPYTLSSRVLFSHPAFSHPALSHPAPFPLNLSHSNSQLCAYAGAITFTIVVEGSLKQSCSRASTIRSHRACGLVGHRRPHSLSLSLCVSLLPYTNCYLTITSIYVKDLVLTSYYSCWTVRKSRTNDDPCFSAERGRSKPSVLLL